MTEAMDKDGWVHRCVARLLQLDPLLDPELARPIAEDMFGRARWHDLGPEAAAQTVFDLGNRPETDSL